MVVEVSMLTVEEDSVAVDDSTLMVLDVSVAVEDATLTVEDASVVVATVVDPEGRQTAALAPRAPKAARRATK
jgi:hypothetical protein